MQRIVQIRSVIQSRQVEEQDRTLTVAEAVTRHLVGAIYGSAGHKSANAMAQSVQLRRVDKVEKPIPSTAAVASVIPLGRPLYTPEQIEARANQLKAEGKL